MLPVVSNVSTSNASEGSSNVVRRNSDLSETQYYQIQYLSNNTVVGCSSAEGTAISDFSVELAETSGTVLAGVKDKEAKEDTASHVGELSGFTTAQSSECHGNKYECDTCGDAFKKMAHLENHQVAHNERRSYECDICDSKFKTKGNLTQHKKGHTNTRNYPCQECEKSFPLKARLTAHMSAHSNDKPFKCETCSKTYKRKSALTKHQAVHSDEDPHVCKVCGKGFKRKYDLKRHLERYLNIHSNEKSYKCSFCNNTFRLKSILKWHVKMRHDALQNERKQAKKLLKKQNANGDSVVSQSCPVVEQPSTSSAHVNKLKTETESDKRPDDSDLQNISPDLSLYGDELTGFYDNYFYDIDIDIDIDIGSNPEFVTL